jgi:hypothetical protein
VEISFYALAFDEAAGIDEHGNTTLLTDENGDPMIHSMRPELDDPYDGFIVRTHATMLMPLEIGPLEPDPDDPSKLRVRLNTNPRLTKFVFDTRPGDNSTIVPSSSLLSNFREILLTGFADFSYDNHPIFLRLDKRVAFTGTASNALTDVTSWLGLQAVRLAKDGLGLGINKGQDYVTMSTSLHFTQRLVVGGELIEWTIPEY